MARLSTEKFERLKKAFAEQAMTPGQAAPAVGVTYVTAKRWYEKWGDDIKRSLESRLLPTLNNNSAVKVRLRYGPLHPYIYARRFDPRRLLDDSPSLLPADYRQRELVSTSSGVRFGDGSET